MAEPVLPLQERCGCAGEASHPGKRATPPTTTGGNHEDPSDTNPGQAQPALSAHTGTPHAMALMVAAPRVALGAGVRNVDVIVEPDDVEASWRVGYPQP